MVCRCKMGKKPVAIPEKGCSSEEIMKVLGELGKNDVKWKNGRVFGYIYFIDDEHESVLEQVNNLYAVSNAMNPMAFPALRTCESEIISMTADMLNGDEEVVGSMTSGGTESLLMTIKTYRDYARKKEHKKKPRVVLATSAHPAFDKAGEYFDVEMVHVPIRDDYRADPEKMEKAIDKNTILLVGSACDYPKGVVDPIKELAEIAQDHKIGFHVDGCLGGFMLPWVKKLGYPIPEFDFSIPGVTSMSADTHKYGFGYKGSSVVLYRNEDLLKHQIFSYTEWPGGIYASQTMTGSRPGGTVAATWAAMKHMGQEGYLKMAKVTMETTKRLIEGINKIPGLKVLGKPDMTVFTFGSDEVNIYQVADKLQEQGWMLDRLQRPKCLHCIVGPNQASIVEEFLKDLEIAVDWVRKNPKEEIEGGTAATYGLMAKFPIRGVIKNEVKKFLINQYKL